MLAATKHKEKFDQVKKQLQMQSKAKTQVKEHISGIVMFQAQNTETVVRQAADFVQMRYNK